MVVIGVQLCIPSDRVSLQIPTPKASGLCRDGRPAHPECPRRIHDVMIGACLDHVYTYIIYTYIIQIMTLCLTTNTHCV